MRYAAKKASECPPDAVVIPFVDQEDASEVAEAMNAGSHYHLTNDWAKGPASRYVDDGGETWVVFDTQDAITDEQIRELLRGNYARLILLVAGDLSERIRLADENCHAETALSASVPADARAQARARCAELINARMKEGK